MDAKNSVQLKKITKLMNEDNYSNEKQCYKVIVTVGK